jgi:hypothetical protein
MSGYRLSIRDVTKRPIGGIWVSGVVEGMKFDALVFGEHAEDESFEYQRSRISKLRVLSRGHNKVVFNFDRGIDVAAADETVQSVVDFIAGSLAQKFFEE